MVFQEGSTTVSQTTQGDLSYEITHLSTICAQPCVFTGPDAEAGALTYAGVRVLLLRAIEQQEQMSRLSATIQSLSQETRSSIASCQSDLASLRTIAGTLQQNVHELYSTLQNHGHRLDQLDALTRGIQSIDTVLASFEQRIQNNANAISQLDGQQRDFSHQLHHFCSSEMIDRRVRDLNDRLNQRLAMLEQSLQNVQAQKADLNQISTIVSEQLHAHLTPLDQDIHALYRVWDLNKSEVHSVVSGAATTQHRVQLLHSTPPFVSLMEMMRAPSLPTVTVGPASMGGSSNISVMTSSYSSSTVTPLSPRSTVNAQREQASYLGIEVGPSGDNSSVVVTRVLPGTPAAAGGLRVGDHLVAMCDQSFSSVSELVVVTQRCLSAKPQGGGFISVTKRVQNGHEKLNLWIP